MEGERDFIGRAGLRTAEMCLLWLCCAGSLALGLSESTATDGCNAQAVHALGYKGQGVAVGVITVEHCLVTHEAFYDKDVNGNPVGNSYADWFDATSSTNQVYSPNWHDTTMAGIIASRGGKLYPNHRGVAPGTEIHSVKVIKDNSINIAWLQTAFEELRSQNCRVVVTGFQLPITIPANGSSVWSLLYDYYAYKYDMIFANAAGNDASSITVFGDAFNGITTAGLIVTEPDVYRRVGTASNPGPTIDGRHKPDIAGPAQNLWVPTSSSDNAWKTEGTTRGETSWAGPHTAGVAALLLGYADTTADEADDGKSEVIKAVIVNSAFPNIQDEYGNSTTGMVWNNYRGYGRLDALRAFELLSSPKVLPSSTISSDKGWAYQSLSPGQQHLYTLSASTDCRLVMTLTWNRKVQWNDKKFPSGGRGIIEEGELEASFADLDLEIYEPNDINPLISEISSIDNLEKVDRLLTKTGNYQIKVVNKSASESAAYAMAFELLEPVQADFNIDYIVDTADLSAMLNWWLEPGCNSIGDCLSVDLTGDGMIDLQDTGVLGGRWLMKDGRYWPVQ